ncbi:MAG: hypothetical protein ACI379_04950 [Nocardioides sp.]|uniref:hypothetical protein n=1 Tax=Nocardioides sp. TaxID=35761 RepID=UPI003F05A8B2
MSTSAAEEAFAEAVAAFRGTLEASRAHMAAVASDPVHTPEERREFHEDALSGRLGPDMKRLAQHVEDGDTSWGEVFEGTTEYAELLHGHLDTMEERYAEDWKRTLEDDPTFDPSPVEE